MSKGSNRRPASVSEAEYAARWAATFGLLKEPEDLGLQHEGRDLDTLALVPDGADRLASCPKE